MCIRDSCCCAHHVWLTAVLCVPTSTSGDGPGLQRIRRYLWTTGCHLGCNANSANGCCLRSRCVHHSSLLVYVVNILCKPGRNTWAIDERHVCRHSSCRCSRLHCGSACWCCGCDNNL